MKVFTGDNPSQMYLDALKCLITDGDNLAPRGKKIRELRPVAFEFNNPRRQVTFLKGRTINPFFQLAECLWIISGRSDVGYLLKFNKAMEQFSDDGKHFNSPYGERLRAYNRNNYRSFVLNPIDQLRDVYEKIRLDINTRQAVAIIYNPLFDNIEYTGNGGKDIPCNIVLTFKVRNSKLDLTVFNRSNDLHWGLFGANLPQFTTIQNLMASWLDVKPGTYTHITDSLHIYTEDFGHECTQSILDQYPFGEEQEVTDFYYPDSPRFSRDFKTIDDDLTYYWGTLDRYITQTDEVLVRDDKRELVYQAIQELKDPYIKHTVELMTVYRLYKLAKYDAMMDLLSSVKTSGWKVSCCKFVYPKMVKLGHSDLFDSRVLYSSSMGSRVGVKAFSYIKGYTKGSE